MRWFCIIFILSVAGSIVPGCSSDFEEHYNPSRLIDKNIVEVLEEDNRFSQFVSIIDKLDLRKTLGEAAIYTCLAPTNEHIDVFLKEKGYTTIQDAPDVQLRQFVNYHFLSGMYYRYDIEKRYTNQTTGLNPTNAVFFRCRNETAIPGKYIRIFTDPFFEKQRADFQLLYNSEESGFSVEKVKISADEHDIDATNGVIHVLSSPLAISPRADDAISQNSETTIFSKWLESKVSYELGAKDEFGRVDTIQYKTYSFGRNIANEALLSTIFIPTDEAILEYFEPYMDDLYNTIDSVPDIITAEIIKICVIANSWFKTDIERNNPELRAISNAYPLWVTDILPTITGSIQASNATLYKVNKMIVPPKLHSVEGGIYIKKKVYRQWDWMFRNTNLESGLTEGLYYQHGEKTLLVQPDDTWGIPLAEDMTNEELTLRYEQCRTGIINLNVMQDGGFIKRFYPTEFGYILYDNGMFIDYLGNSVRLLTQSPTWERTNGAIFEVDGFLTPLQKADATLSVYAMMEGDADMSLFVEACTKGNIANELNLTGFFSFTLFVPENSAIMNAGIDISAMTETEARQFVYQYVVANRYIFSDGMFKGNIANKNGDYLIINGDWDTFNLISPTQKTIVPVAVNTQGSNGVIHKINQVF